MSDCKKLDATLTPYVDGELAAAERAAFDAHVGVCPPCHSRVAAERTVRALVRASRPALEHECAPAALRARCEDLARLKPRATTGAGVARGTAADVARGVSRAIARLTPVALAASLVLLVGGAFLYQVTDRSSRVMAAELTADHLKCFGLMNPMLGTHDTPAAVEGSLASSFGWPVRLPDRPERAGLELVGARPCLYGEGRVAHLMYRRNGVPVSVFMLPRSARAEEVIDVMGHEAVIWSAGNRTFVLIARAPRAEVDQMVSFVHTAFR